MSFSNERVLQARIDALTTKVETYRGKVDGLIDGMLDAVNAANARINDLEARVKALEDAAP